MSLINDVLKDLEKRQVSTSQPPRRAIGSRPDPDRRHTGRWPLWLLAAAALGVVVHLSLDGRDAPSSTAGGATLTAQAKPLQDRASPAAETEAKAEPGVRTQPPEPTADARPITRAPSPDTNRPSAEAETPAHTSAPSRNPDDLAGSRADRGEPEQVVPEKAPSEPDGTTESAPQADPKPEADSESTDSEQPEPTISISRSASAEETSSPLATAKRQLARGQIQRAQSRLQAVVDQNPALTEAHELLAHAQLRQRQPQAAFETLERGLQRAAEPERLAAMLGRLLLERGEIARARSVLEEFAPPLPEATDYHLLLAAAHRQAGDHAAAATHYRALSKQLPRRGAVWVGLGASLEALEQAEEAASAYNHALEGDDPRAARFARQRLNALESLIGESQ